jgi:hypothetical protein
MDTDHGTTRSEAEENFKAEYGHYPIRVAARAPTGLAILFARHPERRAARSSFTGVPL